MITPRLIISAIYFLAALFGVGAIAYYARAPLKADLAALKAQVNQQAVDAAELLASKTKEVKRIEAANAAKIAALESEAKNAKTQREKLHRDNLDLIRNLGMRHLSSWEGGRDALPETAKPAPLDNGTCPRQLSRTLERMADWALEADRVRDQLLSCQKYLTGLLPQ